MCATKASHSQQVKVLASVTVLSRALYRTRHETRATGLMKLGQGNEQAVMQKREGIEPRHMAGSVEAEVL